MVSKCWFSLYTFLLIQAPIYSYAEDFRTIFSVPFKLVKKLIIVEAFVNQQKGYFILDTGASSLILCSSYFPNDQPPTHFSQDFGNTSTGLVPHKVQFNWPNTIPQKKIGMITDLTEMKYILGFPIMGYIGHNILKDYEIVFDYPKNTLTLFKLNRKGNRIDKVIIHHDATDTIALKRNSFLPYFTIQLGDQKLKFGIDSGATMNLICPKKAKKLKGYFLEGLPLITAAFNGKEVISPSGKIGGVKIKQTYWNPMKCIQKKMKFINSALPRRLDGLFGYEFLKQHKTAINFKKKELYLWNTNNSEQHAFTTK